MGRTTFEPALANDRWPWPTVDVFVLCSERPSDTPDHALPGGSVEIVYAVDAGASRVPGRDASWSPASQRRQSAS